VNVFFWYWPTRVVPNKGPLNSCLCVRMIITTIILENPLSDNYICNCSSTNNIHGDTMYNGLVTSDLSCVLLSKCNRYWYYKEKTTQQSSASSRCLYLMCIQLKKPKTLPFLKTTLKMQQTSSSSWSIVHKLQWTDNSSAWNGTSADGWRFFKSAGDQIVTRADETFHW